MSSFFEQELWHLFWNGLLAQQVLQLQNLDVHRPVRAVQRSRVAGQRIAVHGNHPLGQ